VGLNHAREEGQCEQQGDTAGETGGGNTFNVQGRTERKKNMVGLGRRKDERLRVEQTLERDDGKQMTAIGSATVVKVNVTLAPIKARVAGVTTTLQLLTSGIGRKDGGRKAGHPETVDKDVIATFGGDTEKIFAQ
jgi:hypothetical protein